MIRTIKKIIHRYKLKNKFPNSLFYKDCQVDGLSNIGKNCVLFPNVSLNNTDLSDYSYIQRDTNIVNCSIGKFCSIASNVTIGLADHPTSMISTSPVFYDSSQPLPYFFVDKVSYAVNTQRTIIEADVWIGQGCMIKAGIKIGAGSIIGAGAVVVKDVEPYSVIGGVPSNHIRFRFDEELRLKLYESKWWELSDNQIISFSNYFNNPNKFINEIEKY